MKEKKNIDRLFQEKFKNFEVHPSDALWERIASAKAEKEDRKIIPFWLRLGGIAAAIAVLISLGFALWNSNDVSPEVVQTNIEKKQKTSEKTAEEEFKAKTTEGIKTLPSEQFAAQSPADNARETNLSSNDKGNAVTQAGLKKKMQLKNNTDFTQVVSENSEAAKKVADPINPIFIKEDKQKTVIAANSEENKTSLEQQDLGLISKEGLENNTSTEAAVSQTDISEDSSTNTEGRDLVAEAAKIEAAMEEEAIATNVDEGRPQRWDVGAVAAPVYYGDFGGSGIDPEFKDNDKKGDVNLSYGVQVSYAVNEKFKIRTGVSNVDLSYGTQDISFAPDIAPRELSGIKYSPNARFISVTDRISPQEFALNGPQDVQGGGSTVSNGSLEQRVGYIEVPVEAVYVLSDKRLGVEVIGGVSTLLLNDNEITIESGGLRTPIGESNSLNNVSFTTNVGVGVNYKITDQIKVQMEPTLKYQLNAFEGTAGDFKPYYLGLYTGVSYRF